MTRSPVAGRAFVVAGSLPALSRQDAEAAITAAGGRVTRDVSKATNVLVAGDKVGSKLAKAESLGVEIWDEKKLLKALKQEASRAASAWKTSAQRTSRQTLETETTTTTTTGKAAPTKRGHAQAKVAKDAPTNDAPATKDRQSVVGAPMERDGRRHGRAFP